MKVVIGAIITSILLLIIGFILHPLLIDASIKLLSKPIIVRSINSFFYIRIVFSIVLSLIPILFLIIDHITKVKPLKSISVFSISVLGSGTLFWLLRLNQLNTDTIILNGNKISNSLSIESLQLEWFLGIGFILGALLSALILKSKKQNPSIQPTN